jgi:transposase
MPLLSELSDLRGRLQADLFPYLEETLGPLGDKYRLVVTVFEMAPVAAFLAACPGMRGRPPADRVALARAFIAKAVHGIATTALLIDRLKYDKTLRWLCGWQWAGSVPSAATFSRAFAEFAATALASRMHEALIVATHKGRLVGHVSRDATAIEAREKPVKVKAPKRCRRKRRPQKGEPGWESVRRLERQQSMTLDEMLADLPTHCAVGIKPDAKGYKTAWTGYKLHLDSGDGGIPLTGLLTSASLHDSQAAIPLAMLTARRVVNLYDLMDPSYHAPEIDAACRALGRIPIVPEQSRRTKGRRQEMAAEARARRAINFEAAEQVRYRERTTAERVNGRLKDEFGGRCVRVRGHAKVMCHLMFGILALTVDQLMRLLGG